MKHGNVFSKCSNGTTVDLPQCPASPGELFNEPFPGDVFTLSSIRDNKALFELGMCKCQMWALESFEQQGPGRV